MVDKNSSNDSNSGPEEKAGAMLRKARLAAGLDAIRLASDLRLSPQALEAIETSNYQSLPGDPYVRATLTSLARAVHLDPAAVVKAYMAETGSVQGQASVAPYSDSTEKLTSAHRNILVVLVVGLAIGMFLILKHLNQSNVPIHDLVMDSGLSADTLAPALDSIPESRALAPDSLKDSALTVAQTVLDSTNVLAPAVVATAPASKVDTVKAKPMVVAKPTQFSIDSAKAVAAKQADSLKGVKAKVKADSIKAIKAKADSLKMASVRADSIKTAKIKADSLKVAKGKADGAMLAQAKADSEKTAKAKADSLKAKSKADSSKAAATGPVKSDTTSKKNVSKGKAHKAVIKSLRDTVWVKISKPGKPDEAHLLRLGKELTIMHTDTFVVSTSARKSVEINLDGSPQTPDRTRFKIYGNRWKRF